VKIQWYINSEGSNFTYAQTFEALTWNLKMISMVSNYEFKPVLPTTLKPGEQARGEMILSFRPKEDFNDPNVGAVAFNGAMFNKDYTPAYTYPVFVGVLMHELCHDYNLKHAVEGDSDYKFSIMTEWRGFGHINRTLLYRSEMIDMNTFFGQLTQPKNVIFADSLLRVMIPAIDVGGVQHWLLAQYLEGNILEILQSSFFGDGPVDNVVFANPSTFIDGILTLDKVHTQGGILENIKLKYIEEDRLLEWQR